MKESSFYQAILEEGEAKGEAKGKAQGARAILLKVGMPKFGPPGPADRRVIEAIGSVESIERLIDRMALVATWAELLDLEGGPSTDPRGT